MCCSIEDIVNTITEADWEKKDYNSISGCQGF